MAAIGRLSGAEVVIVLGDLAATALDIPRRTAVVERDWHGRRRLIAWLPHPNARKDRTFRTYPPGDLELLRAKLKPR
jgi:hypothetical protein